MSDTFTAKTGRTVAIKSRSMTGTILEISGLGTRTTVDLGDVETLREFFQHERDKELGRWRWPERPEYVVYPKKPSMTEPEPGLRVVHEATGRSKDIGREVIGACDATLSAFGMAARAYFAAHPEPKPWHQAKPGEVWIITTENVADEVAVQVTPESTFQYNDGHAWPIRDMPIVSARRIFPEVPSD